MRLYTVYLLLQTALHVSGGAPDDGWCHHPKHVEQFAAINKPCIVASCWTIIKIYYLFLFNLIKRVNFRK